jgi:hypothetical protein
MDVRKLMMASTMLVAMGCFAQTATPNSADQSTAPSSTQSTTAPSTPQDTSKDASQMPQSDKGDKDNMKAEKGAKGEKTLHGCIRQEGSTFWLEEKGGKKVQLNSSQDLSAHVGHEVKVHGSWGMSTASNAAGTSTTADASQSAAQSGIANNQGTVGGSASGSTSLPQTDQGSAAGKTNESGNSGNMPESDKSASSGKAFDVSTVDMVSDSCTMGKKDKDKNKSMSDMQH